MKARSTLAALMVAGLALSTAPAGAGEPNLVEIPLDVDVYAQPGGEGKPRGVLSGGSQVDLLQQTADHWCQVAGAKDAVPGGSGWIWCGEGEDGQSYAVRPVAAGAAEPEDDGMTETTEPSGDDDGGEGGSGDDGSGGGGPSE